MSLLLPFAPSTVVGGSEHASVSLFHCQNFLPVGRSFFNHWLTEGGTKVVAAPLEKESSPVAESNGELTKDEKLKKNWHLIPVDDVYGLLGLEDLKWDANEDEIKKAYRNVSILCHPDKALPENREAVEERFKSMQKKYEQLIVKDLRRAVDSAYPFDEAIPSEKAGTKDDADFFKAYTAVFERNARFSQEKPVPVLGDMNSSNDHVNGFYDFWLSLKSWRDFAYLDEHRPEQANSRDEKRWMIRENQKKQAGKKKEESARVRKLVEDAMKKDPRINRMKKQAEEEKIRKKMEFVNSKKAKQDAELKAKQDEEAKKQAEKDAIAKVAADAKAVKEAFKKAQKNFSRLCRTIDFSDDDIEKLKNNLDQLALTEAADVITASPEEGKHHIRLALARINGDIEEVKAKIEAERAQAKFLAKKKEEEEEAAASKEWNYKEEAILTKAIVKFPGGVSQRWEKITEMVNTVGNRSMKDVLKKVKLLEAGVQTVEKDVAFQQYLDRSKKDQKSVSLVDIMKNFPGMSESEALDFKRKAEEAEAKRITDIRAQDAVAARAAEEEKKAEEAAAEAAAAASESAASDDWNSEEQSAFESALKTVNKDDPERWEKIAALVKTKNKKQVVARFKHIRDEILKKKAAK